MERDSDFGGQFGARDKIGGVEKLIFAMNCARERFEREVHRQILPGCALDGTETRFWRAAQEDIIGRAEFQIAAVAEGGQVETVALKIVGQEYRAANFRVD